MKLFVVTIVSFVFLAFFLMVFVPISTTSGASAFVVGGGFAEGLGGIVVG